MLGGGTDAGGWGWGWGGVGHVHTTCSRSADQTTIGGGGGRRCEERSFKKKKKKKKAAVFSQGPLADTKSAFVCLPGCQIKEFLCVGGSDRVYLTLQLLLCGKCPTVNAGHESHLALDRGSLFSAERGSCLEKIFNGGGVWGSRAVVSVCV